MSDALCVVPCARGLEALLADELARLGVPTPVPGRAEVSGHMDYATALRVCMGSRVASRVLWPVAGLAAPDPDGLYASLRDFRIEEHLADGATFAIDTTFGAGVGEAFRHSQYATQRAKDAIVDRLREVRGDRPDVDRERPDLRLHVHVAGDAATLSIDLSGDALHRRGYRLDGRGAPLKENLAAALLLAMDWPTRAEAGEPLVDPMCGSGTILIEAAMIAGDRAPGLLRQRWGFQGWRGHDGKLWRPIAEEARERARAGLKVLDAQLRLYGSDIDADAVAAAERNADIAGLAGRVEWKVASLAQLTPPEGPGLVLTNPPYGERLADEEALVGLYRELGDVLKHHFRGWAAGVFTAQGPLPGALGLRATKRHVLWNGAIECRLLELPISDAPVSGDGPAWRRVSPASEAFANRLQKNLRHLGKWAKRERVTCYRAYDADLVEYAVAVDLYEGFADADRGGPRRLFAHVQEYQAPATIEPARAEKRLRDVLARTAEVLSVPPEQVVLKVRRKQRPGDQYEAVGAGSPRLLVEEGGHRFYVNLHDHLDTGLFLDQRRLRARVAEASSGKDVLNLFCYTGSATVYAARAGARSTTSVDLSNTYLRWAEENFKLNNLEPAAHRVIQDDCLRWIEVAAAGTQRWDVIFLAPPTFSNSKRMDGTFDVQRDHSKLLADTARLLSPGGRIFFVNHFRRFKMQAPEGLLALELTRKTLPPDFARDPRFHNAWLVTRR